MGKGEAMEKIKKSNLVEEVYSQLLVILASGDYPEGSRLPSEPQLAQALGVSRNTVRTAMSKLIALGIVENQQGYGNCVRSMDIGMFAHSILPAMLASSHDLIVTTEYRIGIESMAARLAAERATQAQIDRMNELCETAARYVGRNDEKYAEYDMAFHRVVAEASGNPLLIRTAEMIETMYTTWLTGFHRSHGADKSHEYHARICAAIADRRPEEAFDAMREHLFDVLSRIKSDAAQGGV